MLVNPESYQVTINELRQRMSLTENDVIIPTGYETRFTPKELEFFKDKYDMASLYVRLFPDFLVCKDGFCRLVEAKQECKSLEVLQLLFNKALHNAGISVWYSFQNKTIPVTKIPIKEIIVPSKYKKQFEENILPFVRDNNYPIKYVGNSSGSGDPFISYDPMEITP